MIYFDTQNDRVASKVSQWCKTHGYDFNIEMVDKVRSTIMYPFNIDAPAEMQEQLNHDVEEMLK